MQKQRHDDDTYEPNLVLAISTTTVSVSQFQQINNSLKMYSFILDDR